MTRKQFEKNFLEIQARALPIFTGFNTPTRSGNLKNSFTYDVTAKGFEITTNLYYMPFTNEQWVSPQWRGRENPNLYWFNNSADYLGQYLAKHLGGNYVRTK
jgi:hypothetical protein